MKIDLTPIYRTSVGFDRLVSMLDATLGSDAAATGYPPYNIEVTGDNRYAISLAVAGFQQEEFEIEVENGILSVRGRKQEDSGKREYLYQGIAARNFERKFNLADYVEVTGASYKNGLLTITLVKQIPEEMKPRRISISSGDNVLEHQPRQDRAA